MSRDQHADRSWLFTGAAGVFSFGFTALVMSFIAEPLLPPTLGWGQAEWEAMREARKQALDLEVSVYQVRLRSPELPTEPLALRIAREELDRVNEGFARARGAPEKLVAALRNGGAVVMAVGAGLILLAKRRQRRRSGARV